MTLKNKLLLQDLLNEAIDDGVLEIYEEKEENILIGRRARSPWRSSFCTNNVAPYSPDDLAYASIVKSLPSATGAITGADENVVQLGYVPYHQSNGKDHLPRNWKGGGK